MLCHAQRAETQFSLRNILQLIQCLLFSSPRIERKENKLFAKIHTDIHIHTYIYIHIYSSSGS